MLPTFKSVGDLVKSWESAQSLIGKKIGAPTEKSSPEEIAIFRKTIGAPETPEGYGSLKAEEIPAELWAGAEPLEKELLSVLHKHHAPKALAQEIAKVYGANLLQQAAAQEAQQREADEKTVASLQKEWGGAEEFSRRCRVVQDLALKAGLTQADLNDPAFSSPKILNMLWGISKLRGEAQTVVNVSGNGGLSVADQIRDMHDPTSTSRLSRDYQGHNGPEAQREAARTLDGLYAAQAAAKKS